MAIPLTGDFIAEKIKDGNEPVFLVEILQAGRFFATREPQFSGQWLAGDGLLAGSGILAGDPYPTYDGGLSQIVDGGIGSISMALEAQTGLARTGSSSVSILNQTLFSNITDQFDLTNAVIRVRLGFFGQTFQDYITIFTGAIEEFESTLQTMELSLIDDTLVNLKNTPPKTGSDFIARAVDVNKTIPVVLGDVDLVPATTQLRGDAAGTLLIQLASLDESLVIAEVGQPFPSSGGELTVGAEVMTYSGVETDVVGQQQGLRLTGLVRGAPVVHQAGTNVTLTSVVYEYLLGFELENVRRIRATGGVAPAFAATVIDRPLEQNGNDPRLITTLTSTSANPGLSATVAGSNRATNLVLNGEGDQAPTAIGWTASNGSWAAGSNLGEPTIQGTVISSQVPDSELRQDVTTVIGRKYRFTASIGVISPDAPPFATIRIGTTAAPASIFDFGEITATTEQGLDLTFIATSTVTRITCVVGSNTPIVNQAANFDHVTLYDLTSENPATSIAALIQGHIPGIAIDTASFDKSALEYDTFGERMAGVLDTTQEAQSLLGRLAQQYRAKTFLDESGKQKLVVFNNAEPALASINSSDVDKGTMRVSYEPEEKVFTRYYVYFNRRADLADGNLGGRESYQNVLFATPEETNSVEDGALQVLCQQARDNFRVDRVMEIFADMIPDATTADRLLSHIVRAHTHRRILASFTTYINNVEFEIADVVRLTHPLLPPSANNVTYEVLEKEIHPNGCQVSYVLAEIRQSQFNSFVENWDIPFQPVASPIFQENWDAPPVVQLALFDDDGNILRCNPYIETWESSVAARDERLIHRRSIEDANIGLEVTPLTESLVASFDDFFPDVADPSSITVVNTSSNELPVTPGTGATYAFGGSFNRQGSAKMFQLRGFDFSIGSDFFGIPAPVDAAQTPNRGVGLGPGSNDAHLFINNNTDPRFVVQRITMNSLVRWQEADFTHNFWVYMTEKGSLHQPFFHNRRFRIGDQTGMDDDDEIAYKMWWDHTDDRWHLVADYVLANGANINETYESHITALKASANETAHTALGSPSLNTWYMVTLRWDLSTTTLDWTINADSVGTNASIVLAGDPAVDTSAGPNGLFFMAENRPQRGLITETDDDSFGMNGRLAQMHTWSRRLTDAEVTELYNSGNSLPYPYV